MILLFQVAHNLSRKLSPVLVDLETVFIANTSIWTTATATSLYSAQRTLKLISTHLLKFQRNYNRIPIRNHPKPATMWMDCFYWRGILQERTFLNAILFDWTIKPLQCGIFLFSITFFSRFFQYAVYFYFIF